MWTHRIVGGASVLIGLAVIVGLLSLFYAPIRDADLILVRLGMPGVLLGGLFGLSATLIGAWFATAPGHATRTLTPRRRAR